MAKVVSAFKRVNISAVFLLLVVLLTGGCESDKSLEEAGSREVNREYFNDDRPFEARAGTNFLKTNRDGPKPNIDTCCSIEAIELHARGQVDAIWGSLGIADSGSVWVGVSSVGESSGQILELRPNSKVASFMEAVQDQQFEGVGNLQFQKKIHSRIRQAADNRFYFSSMDETRENWRENRLPEYGSFIWSRDRQNSVWKMVLKAPEAIIAVETTGRYVYGLAYWGHVLYQYDIHTGSTRSVKVGAVCGHVSRNFLVDARERAYVPKLDKIDPAGGCEPENMVGSLVEIDKDLRFVKQHPLRNFYTDISPTAHQGITAFSFREDRSIVFTSQRGEIYHLIPYGDHEALVSHLGNMDPARNLSITNLVSIDGHSRIGSLVNVKLDSKSKELAWLSHDTQTAKTNYQKITLPPPLDQRKALLLYGSGIRDQAGKVLVGGRVQNLDGSLNPILLRLTPN